MSKKQKTLFETWSQSSYKVNEGNSKKKDPRNLPSASTYNSPGHNAFQPNTFSRTETRVSDGEFDQEAGKTWIYPTNYPVRDYQFSIVQEALFKNTLVILPTGLGKTFIAAVVMYNIYRWYPKGKVVFMAPTRPLVAQQIDACYKVTGISPVDTTQMTGTTVPEERKRMWDKQRVFFLTPQVLVNDLVRNICSASSIKCLVVDEAHKALGNHAYCQVIRELQTSTTQFRVLALSATPGSDTQAVKTVLTNLLISHVEMRTEDSEDVKEYTHTRDIEKIVVPLGDRLLSIKSRFLDVINVYLKRLTQRRVMTSKNPSSLSKFQVLKLREEFTQHPPDRITKFDYGLALADFSLCISLYHAYELLLLHGARPFYNFLSGILNGDKSIPHARAELLKNFDFEELMREVQENYVTESIQNVPNNNMGANGTRVLPGHPKLEKLLEIVLGHFRTMDTGSVASTRVMIFSQYRDSVDEIVEMLNHHQPMIKAMSFIGQSSKSATSVGYSQKHQLEVLQDFRQGGYNTLVSTCVGEEGLDIGEVDLIVCYDCPKSPIRLVQRMGRTGRLRKGRIVILVAEGKEEQMFNSCESKKKAVHRAISKGSAFTHLYHNSPSLIPTGVKPVCVKKVVTIEVQTPFSKAKGKALESAFLNETELAEFTSNFKFPKSLCPLLPRSNFVSIKSDESNQDNNGENSNNRATGNPATLEPRLSLSRWMLWQTTPQRTHMVSHSSRSLLLVQIADKINFPDVDNDQTIGGQNSILRFLLPKNRSQTPVVNSTVETVDNFDPPVIDLCSEEDFGELDDDMDFAPTQEINRDLCPLKVANVNQTNDNSVSKNLSNVILSPSRFQEGSLLEKLFGIKSLSVSCTSSSFSLKLPPLLPDTLSVESFSGVVIEPEPVVESKNCTLRILNNKMKARLKRKSRELGIKLSFSFMEARLDATFKENIFESFITQPNAKNDISCLGSFVPEKDDQLKKAFESSLIAQSNAKEDNAFFYISFTPRKVSPPEITLASPVITHPQAKEDIASFNTSFTPEKHVQIGKASKSSSVAQPKENKNITVLDDSFITEKDVQIKTVFDSSLNLKAKEDKAFFDVSFTPVKAVQSKCEEVLDKTLTPKAVAFDIDFDIPEDFEEKFSDEVEGNLAFGLPSQSESKANTTETNNKQGKKDSNFDGDSSIIFEQFFSNQDDDIADKLEASFCSPLMIKKVVFESDSSNNQKRISKPKNLTLDKRMKSIQKQQVELNKNSEPTQYGLTQLVSLIDDSQPTLNKTKDIKNINFKMPLSATPTKSDGFRSSEEEIEPTPPKEIVPVASKFCYRSTNLDSDLQQNNEKKIQTGAHQKPAAVNSKISFDLSFTPKPAYPENPKAKRCIGNKFDSMPRSTNIASLRNNDVRISFDLSNIECSPEPNTKITELKFKNSDKVHDFDENIALNPSKGTNTPCGDKINSKISFDLSETPIANPQNIGEKAKTCVEQGESLFIKNSLTVEGSDENVLNRNISISPSKFETNISFDLTDVQFSPEDYVGKVNTKEVQQQKLEQLNTNISLDLSNKDISSKDKQDSIKASNIHKQSKFNFNAKIKPCPTNSKSVPSRSSNAVVSFDLSDVQFASHINGDKTNKEHNPKVKADSKEKHSMETSDPIKTFESEALDKVFFDISFDFPDIKSDSNLNAVKHAVNAVERINKPPNQASNNSKFRNEPVNISKQSAPQTSFSAKNSSDFPEYNLGKLKVNQKSEFSNSISKPSTSKFAGQTETHVNRSTNSSSKCISDFEDFKAPSSPSPLSPESPNLFAFGRKRKRQNVLNDTTLNSPSANNAETDDFVEPANRSAVIRKKKKRHNDRNEFLLSQAAVSGSDSSDDENEADGDQLEASFINDNTVVESPLNQRAMYLQSLKDVVGMPNRFKMKERPNRNVQIYSQPIEQDCSDYMLDSFCVDDEDVAFTSSSDEVERMVVTNKTKNNIRKRKRIITANDTSSSDEEFVRKISLHEDKEIFVRKLSPKPNTVHKEKTSKLRRKLIPDNTSNNCRSTFPYTEKSNNKAEDEKDKVSKQKVLNNICQPATSAVINKPSVSNVQHLKQTTSNFHNTNLKNISGASKPYKCDKSSNAPNSEVNSKPIEDLDKYANISFDIGWDDVDPGLERSIVMDQNLPETNGDINAPNLKVIDNTSVSISSHTNRLQSEESVDALVSNEVNRKCSISAVPFDSSLASTSNCSTGLKTILVDSRELASGKPVISCLRNKHGINPFVMQLVSADYILSNKVAVERILDSEFPSFGMPMKFVEKVRAMSELYEKSLVIVEKDSRKKALGFNKLSTKYLQFAVHANLHPTIWVLYSNSVEETAGIIFDVIEKEIKKGLQIEVPVSLSPASQKLYDFYLSLPHVSPICAFNFVYRFPSITMFYSSSVEQLKKAGFISTRKASALLHFLKSELLVASFS